MAPRKQMLFSCHRTDTHTNSQRLWQYTQGLNRFNSDEVTTLRTGRHAWLLPLLPGSYLKLISTGKEKSASCNGASLDISLKLQGRPCVQEQFVNIKLIGFHVCDKTSKLNLESETDAKFIVQCY